MSTEAEKFAPTRRRIGRGASGPGLALAQSSEDDDTDYDYDYDDTPSGNIWRPGAEPGQPPAASPGGRAAGPLPGREAAAGGGSGGPAAAAARTPGPSGVISASPWSSSPPRS